ncbi:MAG: ABC transporter substrate-binding protein [Propionicimonas sp.]
MRRKTIFGSAAVVVAIALSTSGCLSSAKPTATNQGPETSKTTVSVMYNFGGVQDEAFRKDLNAFASKNGITIDYQQSDQFETLIQTKVKAGQAPDIALFPQPGILNSFASEGKLAALDTQVDVESVKADLLPGFLDAATVDGVIYGAPISMNIKSLYWYDKQAFAKAGLTPPKTQDELMALIAKVKAMGKTPICYGMGSDSATGWPGTDWIEDYVLQTNPVDVYDKWTDGEVKFNSPEIRKSFDIYTKIIMTSGNTYGGAANTPAIKYSSAFNPMFTANPGCYTGKQGNFIISFFPAAVQKNLDARVGVFATPTVNGEHPVLGGGDLAGAFTANDTNVKKVMNYLTNDPNFGVNIAKSGAALSPHKSFDPANYPNNLTREIVKTASDATVFRFDGSDQMPAAVGAKSFWTGMVDYTTGATTLDQTLNTIDQSWPSK